MNFLKKLFGFKAKEEQKDNIQQVVTESSNGSAGLNFSKPITSFPVLNPPVDTELCEACGFEITNEQRVVHKFGKAYHLKPCWRKLIKDAKENLFK